MGSPTEAKSVHAMTADERQAMLRRRAAAGDTADAMEIGGQGPVQKWVGVAGRLMALGASGAVFVVMFYHFTASWRAAVVVVGLMLAYMLAVGRMVEGRADRID